MLHEEYAKLLRNQRQLVRFSDRQQNQLNTITKKSKQLADSLQAANAELTGKNALLETLSGKLSRYLSPQVYASIFEGKQDVKVEGRRKKLTVFFSDIAGFTATTDRMEPEELTNLVNDYLTAMSKIALAHGATIDKYIGDAVMAFFGDPSTGGPKQDAIACVRMALAMQDEMKVLQRRWEDEGLPFPFRIRIGINTGWCTVGNFGSEDRLDYTIIGNEVNLAARLQHVGEPDEIIVSFPTYSLVKDTIECEEFKEVEVKGFVHPVRTYKARRPRSEETLRDRIVAACPGLELKADLGRIRGGDPAEAMRALRALLHRLGDADAEPPASLGERAATGSVAA
jgi:class 3 adenylate cyclase